MNIIDYLIMDPNSPKWSLNSIDWQRWIHNALVFISPVVLIYLVAVASVLQGGFSWAVFVPTQVVIGSMVLYVVNVLLDLFRKFAAGTAQ